MQIAQLKSYQDKTNIPSITVTIEKAYEAKAMNKGGFQTSFKVTDGTASCYLKFFTPQPPALAEGSQVTLASVPGNSGQLTGVSVNIWNGDASIQCSEKATINGAPVGAQVPAQQVPAAYQAPPQAQPQAQPTQQYQAPPTVAPQQMQAQQQAPAAGIDDKVVAITAKAAEVTRAYVQELEARGFNRQEAVQLAANAHDLYPVYWFGEKGI